MTNMLKKIKKRLKSSDFVTGFRLAYVIMGLDEKLVTVEKYTLIRAKR